MSFGDAIGECFFNYANFRDRAARSEYWWWALFATVVCLLAWLLDLVVAEPDLTLEEIRARLKSEKRLKTGTTSVWRFYERHDITFKKNSARR